MQTKKILFILMLCVWGVLVNAQSISYIPCGNIFQYTGRDSIYTLYFPVIAGVYTLDFSAESVPDGVLIIVGNDTVVPLHYIGANCRDSLNSSTCIVGPVVFNNRIGPIKLQNAPNDFSVQYDSVGGVARFIFTVKPQSCFAQVRIYSNSQSNTIWSVRMNCIPGVPVSISTRDTLVSVCSGGIIFDTRIIKDTSFTYIDTSHCEIVQVKAKVNKFLPEFVIMKLCDTTMVKFTKSTITKIIWNNGDTNSVRYFTKPEVVSVMAESGVCKWNTTLDILIHKKPAIEIVLDTTAEIGSKISIGVIIDKNAIIGNIIYSPDSIMRILMGDSILILRSQTIVATAIDTAGCIISDSKFVRVINSERIFIPNVFSPNGDMNNDMFEPFGNFARIVSISIYDRWGEHIYYGNKPWDGRFKDRELSPSVYAYVIELEFYDGHRKIYYGDITIIK